MTRTLSRRALSACGVAGALAGALVTGAGAAHAADVPKYGNVRYVFCSDSQDNNKITYYDNLGKREEIATFPEAKEGGTWCRSVDVLFAKETYVWSAVSNKDAHYAYAAIFVNGRMTAREEDRSDYGTHAQAI
ncbi:hypothetical protein ACFVUS_29490 [Nocardia sp. NPDC058058]|uniref:hypothetical protein n=1 Tax=Nocardia sp. NPDC058058 TaxID=3346317 RepID=UPI0036DC1A50